MIAYFSLFVSDNARGRTFVNNKPNHAGYENVECATCYRLRCVKFELSLGVFHHVVRKKRHHCVRRNQNNMHRRHKHVQRKFFEGIAVVLNDCWQCGSLRNLVGKPYNQTHH